jgi:cytochrome c553
MRRILEVNLALFVFLFMSPLLLAQDVEKGASLYKKCIVCHGKNGEGKRSQKAPKIGGQYDWYLFQQLKDIKSMVRKNDVMMPYVKKLSDQDFKDLSAYISLLKQ